MGLGRATVYVHHKPHTAPLLGGGQWAMGTYGVHDPSNRSCEERTWGHARV
jgi:hypothetical protein